MVPHTCTVQPYLIELLPPLISRNDEPLLSFPCRVHDTTAPRVSVDPANLIDFLRLLPPHDETCAVSHFSRIGKLMNFGTVDQGPDLVVPIATIGPDYYKLLLGARGAHTGRRSAVRGKAHNGDLPFEAQLLRQYCQALLLETNTSLLTILTGSIAWGLGGEKPIWDRET